MTNLNKLRLSINKEYGGSSDFGTDLLIAKPTEKNNEMELVAASFYGTKTDLNLTLKSSGSLKARLQGHPDNRFNKMDFITKKIDQFTRKEVKGLYHTRLTIVRGKDSVIDETSDTYPVLILPKTAASSLKEAVFEYVRDSIVSPLFPDVRIPQVLAGELFITIEQATQILDEIDKGQINTIDHNNALYMVGMYYKWVDYLIQELSTRNKLKNLEVIVCPEDVLAYEIVITESEIRDIISTGLKGNIIEISQKSMLDNHYDTFDTYMPEYASTFKERIESISKATHNYGDLREKTDFYIKTLGRQPISLQLDAIEAGLKSLDRQKRVNIVGEPGVGKTYMMSSIAYLDSLYKKKAMKLLVYSPDHLVESAWQNEVEITLTNTKYHHIKSVSDLVDFEKSGFLDDETPRVFILAQNTGKNGYSTKPQVRWENRIVTNDFLDSHSFNRNVNMKVFVCPSCGEIVEKRIKNPDEDSTLKYINVPVGITHFTKERFNNRSCKKCNTLLWGPANKKASSYLEFSAGEVTESKFFYSNAGYLPKDPKALRKAIEEQVIKVNKKASKNSKTLLSSLREAEMQLEGKLKAKSVVSPYKVPVASYIHKKLKNKFTHLILDEIHELQTSSSARTQAAGKLIASVPKIITGTGTMMNGYAESLFFSFFMLYPEKMKKAGYNVQDGKKFQVTFGVTEKRYKLVEDKKKVSLAPKSKPGISPVIFPMFLQDTSIFITIDDLKTSLPKLETKVVEVEVSDELMEGKKELEKAVAAVTKGDVKLFKSQMPTLYSYLDMPTVPKDVKDADGNVIMTTKVLSNLEDKKLEALKTVLNDEIYMKNNRAIIYTYYTSDGINAYLQERLQEEGYRVTVLNKNTEYSVCCNGDLVKVEKNKRERFIKEEVRNGTQILIVNPELVKTGTNLIDFAPIIRYQMDYQVYTERQARGRTRRIGQTKDCTIYYVYYKSSFQEDIAKLMATKIVASEAIEGNMDSKGLDAISNSRTPEEELAKRFYEKMNLVSI